MRLWFKFLVGCIGFYAGFAEANPNVPGWFVVENREEIFSDEEKKQDVLVKDVVSADKEESKNAGVSVKKTESEYPEVPDIRFARNNKDLLLTKLWLQYEFSKSARQNIAVSPLSFYLISVLMANGVVDETLSEFSKLFMVLHLGRVNSELVKYLDYRKNNINIKSSLWGKRFSERYQSLMGEKLTGDIWGIGETTALINDWANANSSGEIKEIASVSDVVPEEIFGAGFSVLEADVSNSKKVSGDFYDFDNEIHLVSMMFYEGLADYFENNEVQVVRLFCGKGNFLTVILPRKEVDFVRFVEKLDIFKLKPEFKRVNVSAFIPQFEISHNAVGVKDFYKQQGVSRLFNKGNYDFAKMVSFDESVYVGDIYFNTTVKLGGKSLQNGEANGSHSSGDKAFLFEANRPFVFMINDGDIAGVLLYAN